MNMDCQDQTNQEGQAKNMMISRMIEVISIFSYFNWIFVPLISRGPNESPQSAVELMVAQPFYPQLVPHEFLIIQLPLESQPMMRTAWLSCETEVLQSGHPVQTPPLYVMKLPPAYMAPVTGAQDRMSFTSRLVKLEYVPTQVPFIPVYFTWAVVVQMPAVVGVPDVPAGQVAAWQGKSTSVGIPVFIMNGIAYSRMPPPHELTVEPGEFWVVHSRTYSSDKSGSVVWPAILTMLSQRAVAVKAQQDPQLP